MKDSRRAHEHNGLTFHGQQQQVESSSVDRSQVQWLQLDVTMLADECSPVALSTSRDERINRWHNINGLQAIERHELGDHHPQLQKPLSMFTLDEFEATPTA